MKFPEAINTMQSSVIPMSPIFANIELTYDCNNHCKGCGNQLHDADNLRKKNEFNVINIPSFEGSCIPTNGLKIALAKYSKSVTPLSSNQWKEVLLKLKKSINQVRFTGGEPTVYPGFMEVASYTSELKIPFGIFTNGRWNRPEHLVDFLSDLNEFKGLLVSLHGDCPEIHEAFTGVDGSFAETISNIQLSIGRGIKVNTNTVITNINYDRIGRIVDYAHSLGVSTSIIARYIGEPSSELKVNQTQLKTAVLSTQAIIKKGLRVKFSGCIPQCFVKSRAIGCTAGFTFFTVDPCGNVRPCNHSNILCGNVIRQSINEIWFSRAMDRWRNSIPYECQACPVFSSCHGGCHAEAIASRLEKDPLMTKQIVSEPSEYMNGNEVIFYKTDRPTVHCEMRSEPFGYLLICGSLTLPVSHDAKMILDACDGTNTLMNIHSRFGQKGIDFVGALIEQEFIQVS
jgi:AdoMet-dependent heme synthase